MDATDFYGSILAPVSFRVLAVFKDGLGAPPKHYFFGNDADLVSAALTHNKLGRNVYHGCATYSTNQSRKGSNVAAVKSLWIDLDVGEGKPYANAGDAVDSLEEFRSAVGLKAPHYVSSGYGIHAYFPLKEAISPQTWVKLATVFAECLNAAGVKHDSSRTKDVASILRVPGTTNFKNDQQRSVELISFGEADDVKELLRKLLAWAKTAGVNLQPQPPAPKQKLTAEHEELIGQPSFAPADADKIVAACPAIEEVDRTGGDVEYGVWWCSMGIAKFTTTPDETAARWTRERASTNHSKHDWARAMAEWNAGPTTCTKFSEYSTKCATCQYKDKLSSPIRLGVPDIPPVEPLPQEPKNLPYKWEFGAQWIVDAVNKSQHIGVQGGKLTYPQKDPDDPNIVRHVPFCDRYWQVMRRVRGPDNQWMIEIGYAEYPGMPHKTFLMESAAVTSPDQLRKSFSAHELHLYGNNSAQRAMNKIRYEQHMLYELLEETTVYPVMGWVTQDNTPRGVPTGEFVIGNSVVRPHSHEGAAELADTVPRDLRVDFRVSGTAEEWARIVDVIYNRPKAQPYQFVIAAMFASPLVALVPGAGDWHGIPIALYGDSGAAKTTTALVGLSIYGPPQLLRFNANSDHKNGGQGDTINAFALKVGSLQNIPFLADEMTGLEPEKMSAIMYMLANGKSKDRMAPNGTLIPNPYRWDVISIATGNEGFHAKLEQLRNKHTQEASMLRCFEIELRSSDLHTVFHDVNRTFVEDALLAQQYGAAGRKWLQFVVNNREKISELLAHRRATMKLKDNDTSSLRFYKDLLITVEIAAKLAQKLGLIKWDVDAMMAWATSHVERMAVDVLEDDWTGVISDFIASLHGRTIVTRRMASLTATKVDKEFPLETLGVSIPPVARRAIDDRVFYVTVSALNEWARDRRITGRDLATKMAEYGYIVGSPLTPLKINIGHGTTIARPLAPCFELNYAKCIDALGPDEQIDTSNVVALRAAAPSRPASGDGSVDAASE